MKTVKATSFKAKCLKIMDDIHHHQTEIVVTKRGKPWVKVIPVDQVERQPLIGALAGTGQEQGDLTEPIDLTWNMEQ